MRPLLSRIGMLILITLVLNALPAAAQDETDVMVVGSGIVTPVIEALAEEAGVPVTVNVAGTNAGFASFCAGDAAIVAAARPLSAEEQAACDVGGVNFVELPVAYEIVGVIGNAESDFGQCLTTGDLDALFSPSATADNWSQLAPTNADIPLTLYVPAPDTTEYTLLDTLVDGIGTRASATTPEGSIVEAVSTTPGAIGVVDLAAAQAAGDDVTIFELNTNAAGCAEPSAENVEARTYDGAYRLFAYVNADALPAARPIYEAAYSDQGAAIITTAGFTPLTANTLEQAQTVLSDAQIGRQFSREVVAFEIPQNLTGAVNIAGSASGAGYVEAVTGAFVQSYPAVTVTFTPEGEPAGIRRFCNGEVEIILAYSALTEEQLANCDANNVIPETIPLATQAVVLVANANSDHLTCLSTDTIAALWAAAAETPATWNQVDSEYPEQDIFLFAPTSGSVALDVLLLQTAGAGAVTRTDLEENDDPLYRGAAAANVEGGLALLTWDEYQAVIDAGQENIQLVSINAGGECIEPTLETINSGDYPLARQINLIVNQLALGRQEVQSLVWYMFTDQNYPQFAMSGLVPVPFPTLPDVRAELETTFATAAEAAAQAVLAELEATPEATGEATPDATPEATAEATAETSGE